MYRLSTSQSSPRKQHTSYRWSRVVEYLRLVSAARSPELKTFQEGSMGMLFMVNVPHNCSDEELTWWVESSGIEVKHVRVIRDTVSGASPSFAYVDITEKIPIADAGGKLNGHNIRERTIVVSEARRRRQTAA